MEASQPLQLTIVPRKRKNEVKASRQPVVLCKITLRNHRQYSQREAAAKLGISLSALKSACKYFGINKWWLEQSWCDSAPSYSADTSSSEDSKTALDSSCLEVRDTSIYSPPLSTTTQITAFQDRNDLAGYRYQSFFEEEVYEDVMDLMMGCGRQSWSKRSI
ncbi:hypothetical protein GUITHDRAFT_153104 [Guillardia theta CCMP2712]|uniref:RWP-RK domain-containing protein n=1 Tax=Guillardia theta (strain CCMP2712) TaxID=905079 RepID=L1J750_GUITC|nr:hypothetical protein GUITHDRAFT_153104 [Guillardia theta CCMP2712]EKX43929.1 hypothetical protein GUITHDRAFT_153104 [Guillardia theta CCMP2712]|eukprot:XP_005830909.1 hypothetical protein GUITHDRAFT_153104 [Guillardia theta CCMP2712]